MNNPNIFQVIHVSGDDYNFVSPRLPTIQAAQEWFLTSIIAGDECVPRLATYIITEYAVDDEGLVSAVRDFTMDGRPCRNWGLGLENVDAALLCLDCTDPDISLAVYHLKKAIRQTP